MTSQEGREDTSERAAEWFAGVLVRADDYLYAARGYVRRTRGRSKLLGGRYGYVRGYYRSRSEKYTDFRRHLNQARISVPYDVYLTRAFVYSAVAAMVGVVAGIGLAALVGATGSLDNAVSPIALTGSAAEFASENASVLQGIGITAVTATILGSGTWLYVRYLPRLRAGSRARNIDLMLPHAITFMYALTYGGISIIEAMKELARSEDVYGEVANEFDAVIRDMEEFGTPLPTALQNARGVTPSEGAKRFFDDLMSTIDSGGDVTKFLYNEGDRYYTKAKDEQEDFIQTLGVLGEVYAAVFIGAPLLFLIILLVMSFVGAPTLSGIRVLTYIGMPLGVLSFGILLHVLSKPYSWKTGGSIGSEQGVDVEVTDEVRADPRYASHRRSKALASLMRFLNSPLDPVRRKPALSLFASVPAAVLTYVFVSGTVPPGSEPVRATTIQVVVPTLVAVIPLTYFHEMRHSKERSVVSRFADKLNAVANANDMGMSLREGFSYVSRRGSSEIDAEFARVSNDIGWKNNTERALVDCANRLRVPQVTRSMNLISKASRATGELDRILEAAAQDTANEYRLKRRRAAEMSAYIAVIVVSFLVYLSVVLLLDRYYLVPLYEAVPVTGEAAIAVTEVPIETYRSLFYHSSLILAFGNGMLAGKMGENDLFAGLKYAVAFTTITAVSFLVIT
jgi:flagellar protein FlaJ